MRCTQRSSHPYGRNILALLVAVTAIGIAQLNLDPFQIDGIANGSSIAIAGPPQLSPPTPEHPVPVASETSTADHTSAKPQKHDDPAILRGIWAVKMAAAILERGSAIFSKIPDYTACMYKQERIGGALGECQIINVKIRHEPFSVYMKWVAGDKGRQLIYVDGQNDGNMLVQPGGIKGRLTGVLSLEPTGALAMSDSRHSITQAGILELARTVLSYQNQDIERGHGFDCQLYDNQEFEGRNCYLYVIEYESAEFNETYRKSMVYIDKELSMPICVKNYTWGVDVDPQKIDEETLIEFYAYTDVRIEQELTAADFDQHNKSYRLRVR